MAHIATDLAVTLPEDRPGMLSKAVTAVSAAGINLEGHAEMEGVVHVLTTDAERTRDALEAAGFQRGQGAAGGAGAGRGSSRVCGEHLPANRRRQSQYPIQLSGDAQPAGRLQQTISRI